MHFKTVRILLNELPISIRMFKRKYMIQIQLGEDLPTRCQDAHTTSKGTV
jgi:hypothetical protein